MKLYYVPQTRAARARWMLEELELPYELHRVDNKNRENDRPAYRALQPLGHVPVLVDGDLTIYESAAIVAWLADRFPEKKLAPPVSDVKARAAYQQWMFFGMATLEPPIAQVWAHTRSRPEEKRIPMILEEQKARFADVATVVQREVASKPWILGDAFSAADVVVGGNVNWARGLKMLEEFPVLKDYSKRLMERPAFQRATKD